MSTQRIIVVGNPVDGFTYHGPLDEFLDEIDYGFEGDWWVAEIHPIEPLPKHYPNADIPIPPPTASYEYPLDNPRGEGLPENPTHWMPTHYSKLDGSPARYVDMEEDGIVIFENENGDTWVDDLCDWIDVATADAEDVKP